MAITTHHDHLLAAGIITQLEHEAITLDQRGLSQRQIALALRISRTAVRDRLKNAARKTAAHNQEAND
jgi:predicted DNA-binding protein (UPF0251 family)